MVHIERLMQFVSVHFSQKVSLQVESDFFACCIHVEDWFLTAISAAALLPFGLQADSTLNEYKQVEYLKSFIPLNITLHNHKNMIIVYNLSFTATTSSYLQ